MRFLKRKAPKASAISLSALTLPSGSLLSIVGESHYQPALEMTAGIATRGQPPLPVELPIVDEEPELLWFQAVLVREPDNEYDSNAIAVTRRGARSGTLVETMPSCTRMSCSRSSDKALRPLPAQRSSGGRTTATGELCWPYPMLITASTTSGRD